MNGAKATRLLWGFLILLAATASAQVQTVSSNVATAPGYVCVQRGPNSRVWESSTFATNSEGDVTTNFQSYTELGTGICFSNDSTAGQWVDSVEQVEAVAGGAQAVQGRHHVYWANNANTPGGALTVTTPDGKQLSSAVFGIAYFDLASGSNAPVAYIQSAEGAIVAPNQVVYSQAFTNLNADLLYTYTKAGLSQDVVLHQAPPAPHRFGLSDQTTVLQIYSQFFNPPMPQATCATNGNVVDDQVLSFGEMAMGVGQTLFLDGQDAPLNVGSVTKQWVEVNNSTFLIEAIPWISISNQLGQMPQASNIDPTRGSVRRTAFLESKPASSGGGVKTKSPMKVAKAKTGGRRLVVDYDLLESSGSVTLQGDSTYLVASLVNITGTLTIEGGTVVKYTNTGVGEISVSGSGSNVVCETSPYHPAVFTSIFDSSVGSVIATGTPTVACTYLSFDLQSTQAMTLRYLRFSYASTAIAGTISSNSGSNSDWIKLWDCQFYQCTTAFSGEVYCPLADLYLYNVLFSEVNNVILSNYLSGTLYAQAENVTADRVNYFAYNIIPTNVTAVNCIFTTVTNEPLASKQTNCASAANGSAIYEPVGAGGYYLTNTSTNVNAGTTDIDSNLLADLQTLTTQAPIVLSGANTTNSYTLSPQVPRDTNMPDLGFHYCALDYALNIDVSGASITVQPGTALGMFGNLYGIWLYSDAVIESAGTATSPNYIVRYNTVQEQSSTNWESTNWSGSILVPSGATGDSGDFAFTEWSVLASDCQLYIDEAPVPFGFMSCQFYGGGINDQGGTISSTNSLYWRVGTQLLDFVDTPSNSFYNNLFWEGSLTNKHNKSGIWTFRDNLFDQVIITNLTTNLINVCYSNAYVTNVTTHTLIPLSTTNDAIFLASSPSYQTGVFGPYYYPSNYVLFNHGSWSATNVGLYHYTVITNDYVVESNGTVSIGYHYVAVGTNNQPLCSNTNDVADYLADANGDGLIDDGELPWYDVPEIITQPSLSSGSNIIGLVAGGSPALAYQWRNDGTNITGATMTNYTATNSGHYTAQVTNPFGLAESAGVDVAMLPASNLIANPGDVALMTAPSGGTQWQWSWNGSDICGATESSLTISPVDATNAGTYEVTYNPPPHKDVSSTILLVGPEIIVQPQDFIAPYSNNANFSVTAIGTPPFSYQWQLNGTDISGATTSVLDLANVAQSNTGSYTVAVTSQLTGNFYGVTSYYAILTMTEPFITTPTNAYYAEPGQSVNLSNTVVGDSALGYQWYKQVTTNARGAWYQVYLPTTNTNYMQASISDEYSSTITLSGVSNVDSGVYRLLVTSPNTGVSQLAGEEINLYVDPAITGQPKNQVIDVSNNVTFTVGIWATNTNIITYQWQSNTNSAWVPISWATNATMTLSNITTNCSGSYSVIVSNTSTHHAVTSSSFDGILSVRTPIWLTTSYYANNVSYYYQSYSNSSIVYWYQIKNADDYTSILTSSIPHIVHYDAGVFQTRGSETFTMNTAQSGWQHWGNKSGSGSTTLQLVCNVSNAEFNYIFSDYYPQRSDGFEVHDLTLDCNASASTNRDLQAAGTWAEWCGVLTAGNNVLISNTTFVGFGNQGGQECFPLSISPGPALDENCHMLTLYSNMNAVGCVFTNPGTGNGPAGLTVGAILPGWESYGGVYQGTIFYITNSGFSNCVISNVNGYSFDWDNGFTADLIQNCVVDGCTNAVYFEVPNPVYYGQNALIQSNYFTNVTFGFNLTYNDLTFYPTAVGNITLISNVIALTNAGIYGAGVIIQGYQPSYALPQIPSLTAEYNQITTVDGDQEWGFYLWNISNAVVVSNTLNNSYLGLAVDDRYNRPNLPLSFLVARHNTYGAQLVNISGGQSVTNPPSFGTQQKGDFNLDGYTDLLWHNSGGQNTLWTMDVTNTNSCGGLLMTIPVATMAETNWVISGTADFTGDCNNDILWTMPGTTNLLLWTMMGPSFITSNWMPALPSGYGVAGTGDFNGDGKTDLVLTNSSTNTFLLWLMNGTSVLSNVTVSANWPTGTSQIVGAGPFNGGEQADILFRDYSTGDNYIWNMSGTTFIQKITLSAQSVTTWRIAGVGDFNGDGIADIVWRNPSTGANSIWLTSSPLSTTYTNVNLTSLAGTSWTIGGPR